ncbi:MAG: DMT family transporter [Patescibacteria group bacterium]
MQSTEEHTGERMLLGTCVIEGLFPIMAVVMARKFPPVLFTAISSLCASVIFLIYLWFSHRLSQQISIRALLYSLGVAVFVVMTLALILIGAKFTSSVNVALLLQTEMLYTFIFATIILGERLFQWQLVGVAFVFLGTVLVIFNGTFDLNTGDVIIIGACVFFPIGNMFAKKALAFISTDTLLFLRYLLGGSLLLVVSFLFEDFSNLEYGFDANTLAVFAVYVVLFLVMSKVLWYGGLKRLAMGKAVYIISASPAFSLLFAFILLREIPTWYQFAGFAFTVTGIYFLISRQKVASTIIEPL